jgi:hypothetical protein
MCLAALAVLQLGAVVAVAVTALFAAAGAFAIFVLETPGRGRLAAVAKALPAETVSPERSVS